VVDFELVFFAKTFHVSEVGAGLRGRGNDELFGGLWSLWLLPRKEWC
jgi:hypothetical protein